MNTNLKQKDCSFETNLTNPLYMEYVHCLTNVSYKNTWLQETVNLLRELINAKHLELNTFIDNINSMREKFLSYLELACNSCFVVIVIYFEKYDSSLIKKTKNFFGENDFVFKAELVELFKLQLWQIDKIESLVMKQAKDLELIFLGDSFDFFVGRFKHEPSLIKSELKKIRLFILPENEINTKILKDLYESSYILDDLIFAILTKNNKNVVSILKNIQEYNEPIYLISLLQYKIRNYFYIKVYFDASYSLEEISKFINVSLFKLKSEINFIKNVTLDYIKGVLSLLSQVEYSIKSGSINKDIALDVFLMKAICCYTNPEN